MSKRVLKPPPRTKLSWLLFLLFATLLVWQAFLPPPVGLANNGDFYKVAAVFNLTAPTDDEFRYLIRTWRIDPAAHLGADFVSSEQALAAAAVGINSIVRSDGLFDIRMIGAVHALLFLLAFI